MGNIEDILSKIEEKLNKEDKQSLYLLFAFNATGKTRLSKLFKKRYEDEVLCYNAFMEDLFYWDNENTIFRFDADSALSNLFKEEGNGGQIVDNFKKLTGSKIEPSIDWEKGTVSFGNFTGDSEADTNIKISRGEESLFIWSVFYTILSGAIDALKEAPANRSTHLFDNLKYIVIDDPVSSMDDTRIITMALDLIELLKEIPKEQNLKILITTHHCLFYNIMYKKKRDDWNQYNAFLVKSEDSTLNIKPQSSDSPFSYHITVLEEIRNAIENNQVQKYHFNLFRALLEKTANFLGYTGNWSTLLKDTGKRRELIKLLNLHSHSSLSEIETKDISPEDLTIFTEAFNNFVEQYHWNHER